ncbi:hypothetical protein MMC17_003249 [Xylographa soralifera]|nr:hypothetical protein [Xylographa soralifera]
MAPQKIEQPGIREKQLGLTPVVTSSKSRRTVASTTNSGNITKDATTLPQVPEGSNGQQAGVEAAGGVSQKILFAHQYYERDLPYNVTKINWSTIDRSTLHAYRHAYRLNTPSAFTCAYNQLVLTGPGLGRYSPTMARAKDRRRVSKEQLALAVRKDFNAAGVIEQEVVTSFLYSVHNQSGCLRHSGDDKEW